MTKANHGFYCVDVVNKMNKLEKIEKDGNVKDCNEGTI